MNVYYLPSPGQDAGTVTARETALAIAHVVLPQYPAFYRDSGIVPLPTVLIQTAGAEPVWIPDNPPTDAATVAAASGAALAAEQTYTTAQTNAAALLAKAAAAIATNTTFEAIATPTAAQVSAQVAALTRQVTVLIRLAANLLSTTAGT